MNPAPPVTRTRARSSCGVATDRKLHRRTASRRAPEKEEPARGRAPLTRCLRRVHFFLTLRLMVIVLVVLFGVPPVGVNVIRTFCVILPFFLSTFLPAAVGFSVTLTLPAFATLTLTVLTSAFFFLAARARAISARDPPA